MVSVKELHRQLRLMYLPLAVFADEETQVFWFLRVSPGGEKKPDQLCPHISVDSSFSTALLAAKAPGYHRRRSLEQPNSVLIKVIFKLENPTFVLLFLFFISYFFLFGKPPGSRVFLHVVWVLESLK